MGIVIGQGRQIVIRLPGSALGIPDRSLPMDVRLAMFMLEAHANETAQTAMRSRSADRLACRLAATLFYPADVDQHALTASAPLYLRDISAGHAGFICREMLASSSDQACLLRLDQPDGSTLNLRGQIGRCRPFMDGWYEGVISFDIEASDQAAAEDEPMRIAV